MTRFGPSAAAAVAVIVLALCAALLAAPPQAAAQATPVGADPLRGEQWALPVLDAEDVWAVQRAAGSLVAVVDTGVDAAHPDLDAVVVSGLSTTGTAGQGTVDPSGHGTGVAGIIGATVGNDLGLSGLAPDVTILPVQVLDRFRIGSVADVEKGIRYASRRGADVINLSFGSASPSGRVRDAIDDAVRGGAVVVASAGNTLQVGNDPRYPAADSDVLSVAAVGRTLRPAPFSTANEAVDLAAPGVDILMPAPGGTDPPGRYVVDEGTSFAAPFVSAAAALVAARFPRATPAQITERLLESARDLPPAGVDDATGHGLVQPLAALSWEADSGCQVPADVPLARVFDDDRVGTAAAAACTYWPVAATTTAVIATATDYPDALAGAALAARRRAPLLLTDPDELRPDLAQVLGQLGVTDVLLLGGVGAVGADVEDALGRLGITVERVAGATRYATAAAVARRAGAPTPRVVVTTGTGYADALSAGAYLATDPDTAPPVLLTPGDDLGPAAAAALSDLSPREVILVGGTQALSPAVAAAVAAAVPDATVRRVSGADRYATSAEVVADVAPQLTTAPLVFATGAAFPDALAAGALAGRVAGPVLLVEPGAAARAAAVAGQGAWSRGLLMGGPAAVSAADATILAAAFTGGAPPAPTGR